MVELEAASQVTAGSVPRDGEGDGEGLEIAVLIPCRNEETAIAKVVGDFRSALPDATVYVYNNGSTDATAQVAAAAGAVVGHEGCLGKGNVVRRMFGDIDADIYVLVDGDDTYDARCAPALVSRLITHRLDMVNGKRQESTEHSYRSGHRLGNAIFNRIVRGLFGDGCDDMLSGYKVLSRRFVRSFPALSREFEIETELIIHALTLRLPFEEVPTPYKERPQGSASKLRTFRDGARILTAIFLLLKEERPLLFYASFALALSLASVTLAVPVLLEYLQTGLVPRFPTAILSTGLMLSAFLSLASGLILSTVTRGRREMKRMMYLSVPPLPIGRSVRRVAVPMGAASWTNA
jgi:hypothetical protein